MMLDIKIKMCFVSLIHVSHCIMLDVCPCFCLKCLPTYQRYIFYDNEIDIWYFSW